MMTRRLFAGAALCLAPILASCKGDAEAAAAKLKQERDQRTARVLAKLGDRVKGDNGPIARWLLPHDLAEISGIVLTPDGRLFAHNDERGRISVIDPLSGFVSKAFDLKGSQNAQDDFEGITLVGDTFHMITSNGRIYTFAEGQDESTVDFEVFDTRLGKECEFEGIAYNATDSELILPCKRADNRDLRDQVVIYRVPLPLSDTRPTLHAIPIDNFRGTEAWKELQPTDITRDSVTGNYIMVAAPQKALIVLSPNFEVLRATLLPDGHEQPEGVALTGDGVLIISDEARGETATLTLYRWTGPGAPLSAPRDSTSTGRDTTSTTRATPRATRAAPLPARDTTP